MSSFMRRPVMIVFSAPGCRPVFVDYLDGPIAVPFDTDDLDESVRRDPTHRST
jgi:hypothetical protein